MENQNWLIRTKRGDFSGLSKKYNIDPVVARILVNRDIPEDGFSGFLKPSLENLHDPFLMEDMNQAVRIICHDVEEGHKIRIVSDYDVDGVMSNYILYKGFQRVGATVDYVIPHRVKDGYGINEDIIVGEANGKIIYLKHCNLLAPKFIATFSKLLLIFFKIL